MAGLVRGGLIVACVRLCVGRVGWGLFRLLQASTGYALLRVRPTLGKAG